MIVADSNDGRGVAPTSDAQPRWVLQLCHGYDGPFMDCARQYAVLFQDTDYKVCTVYLTGPESEEVRHGSASDEVVFLNYSSRQLRGLKLNAIKAITRISKQRNFALCIAHRFKPTYIALLATSLPVIGIQHAFGVYRRRSRKLLASLCRHRLFLLCVSNAVRDDVQNSLQTRDLNRVETLHNRIDVEAVQAEQINRVEARKVLGLPETSWIVGNVGRLHPDKDQATLIRGYAQALPSLPADSLLVIIGTGKLEADLKELVESLGIDEKVVFLGQVPRARRYFKAFDVFALTSDREPFGMVLLEAMAAEIPIISSNNGGAVEVVDGYGQVFPFADEKSLGQCLTREYTFGVDGRERAVERSDILDRKYSDRIATQRFFTLINKRFR